MNADGASIALSREGAIARLQIARESFGNALRGTDLLLLASLIRECLGDRAIRVIVLSGSGEKFFCTGSDVSELAAGVSDIGVHLRKWHDVVELIETSEKPVIAAINGAAVGGGLELALACHQRIAVSSARVGLPELKVGLFPAAGGVRRLTRLIGAASTCRLVFGADLITANAAQKLGIVDQVCDAAEFDAEVTRAVRQLAGFEPNAVRAVLSCARQAAVCSDSNEHEVMLLRDCYATPRNREILQEFMARPRPAQRAPR